MLAIVVAVLTTIVILTLREVGSVRYTSNDSRSALAQLKSSLQAVGITQTDGTIQNQIQRTSNPFAFRAATYWSSSDLGNRRDEYLAAGGFLALTLLLAAFVLERRAVQA
jgi:hypothetical protein